jgi:hypothetical protein
MLRPAALGVYKERHPHLRTDTWMNLELFAVGALHGRDFATIGSRRRT